MEENSVTIVQDERLVNIVLEDLRQGDTVVVQAGDIVPADLELVESRALEIDEFEITGEILPVSKQPGRQEVVLYRGSRITRGTGKGKVIATGANTEFGAILTQEERIFQPEVPPLFRWKYLIPVGLLLPAFIIHLTVSSNRLMVWVFYLFVSIFLLVVQNNALFDYGLISIASKKLAQKNILTPTRRDLDTLSQVDLFCFDKTGVLTGREISVSKLYFSDQVLDANQGFDSLEKHLADRVKIICALCNDVLFLEKLAGADPVDKALISFARQKGIHLTELWDSYPRIYDEPFDSENRYMACGFKTNLHQAIFFAKGDPGVILQMCKRYLTAAGEERKIDFNFWEESNAGIEAISKNGDTAIALAFANGTPDTVPGEFIYVCTMQLRNVLQPGARQVVARLGSIGIRSIMVTGDRAETALRISAESGLTRNTKVHLTGQTIDRMDLAEVARQAEYCSVFARLIPSQKGALIRLLQQKGHLVAMVGDGTNDGIALRVADIGISFVKDSSPIARKFADILVHQLTDILALVESARRLATHSRQLNRTRILTAIALLAGIYGWLMTQVF